MEDIRVDNLAHSTPGGLTAHNYWDNTAEVVPRIVALVRSAHLADGSAEAPSLTN